MGQTRFSVGTVRGLVIVLNRAWHSTEFGKGDLLGTNRSSVSIDSLTHTFLCQDIACIIEVVGKVTD